MRGKIHKSDRAGSSSAFLLFPHNNKRLALDAVTGKCYSAFAFLDIYYTTGSDVHVLLRSVHPPLDSAQRYIPLLFPRRWDLFYWVSYALFVPYCARSEILSRIDYYYDKKRTLHFNVPNPHCINTKYFYSKKSFFVDCFINNKIYFDY